MKTLLMMLALALPTMAADGQYLVQEATTALTVQRPAAANQSLQFKQAWFYCAASQTVTLSWNGTAATATAATIKRLPPTSQPPQAVAFSGSNVGSGTTGPAYVVPAGLTFTIDLSVFTLGSTGANTNLTLSATGTCTIAITWSEK